MPSARQSHEAPAAKRPDDILRWLLRLPLLRVEEIAFLAGVSRSRTYARLSTLQGHGLVTRWTAPVQANASTQLYALTAPGLAALAAAYGSSVWALARQWQSDERGIPRLLLHTPTLLGTQSFVVALLSGASRGLHLQSSATSSATHGLGKAHQAQIEWSWQRDYPLRYMHRSRTGCMRLSAYVRFAVDMPGHPGGQTTQRRWHGLFVLADSGLADAQDQHHQLRTLAWCRDTFLDQTPDGHFPPLLILTTTAHRAMRWQSLALRFTSERWQTHPLIGALLCMEDANASTPWRAAWRPLISAATCHLAEVLVPVDDAQQLPVFPSSPDTLDGSRSHSTSRVGQYLRSREDRYRSLPPTLNQLTRAMQQLEPRHMSILNLLYEHPLLSVANLAAFLDVADVTVDRYLRLLTRLELTSDQPAVKSSEANLCGQDRCHALTHFGLSLLAAGAGLTRWHARAAEPQRSGSVQRLPAYIVRYEREVTAFAHALEHTAGIYSFFAQLATVAHLNDPPEPHHSLLWWETGRACERYYREMDGWHAMRPDGAGEYQAGQRRFRFWLEWDRGTMNRRDLEVKFAAYDHYIRSREWRTDGNDPLPMLLVVTSNVAQETLIGQALRTALADHPAFTIRLTLQERLSMYNPLSAIWKPYHPASLAPRWAIGEPNIPLVS